MLDSVVLGFGGAARLYFNRVADACPGPQALRRLAELGVSYLCSGARIAAGGPRLDSAARRS